VDVAKAKRALHRRDDAVQGGTMAVGATGVENPPGYSKERLEALAAEGLAFKRRNGTFLPAVNRYTFLVALAVWKGLEVGDPERLPLKGFLKTRAIYMRLERELPANWLQKVPASIDGSDG
jgi:hypothetical protein